MALRAALAALLACLIVAQASAQGNAAATTGKYTSSEGSTYTMSPTSNGATLTLTKGAMPQYGADITPLRATVDQSMSDVLHVKIADANGVRWQVPEKLYKRDTAALNSMKGGDRIYNLSMSSSPLGFAVNRIASNGQSSVAYDTTGLPFIFKNQYIEVSFRLDPTSTLYGLGEQTRATTTIPRQGGVPGYGAPFTFWPADRGSAVNNSNTYASWPFLVQVHADGSTDGLLILNSNGMDVFVDGDIITYKIIGGILDLWFFMGPTPADVMNQYTAVVGRPAIPPYWSLGFHQCKYGYLSIWEVMEVVANYTKANIPLEVMWTDIDYMDHFRAFTVDPKFYPLDVFQQFLRTLHANGQKWIPIVDPAISVWTGDETGQDGVRSGAFIKDYTGKNNHLVQVWPGVSYLPDYLNPATQGWWTRTFKRFHDMLPFDGVWIDMNEPSNFCYYEYCTLPQGHTFDNLSTLQNPIGVPNWMCNVLQCTNDTSKMPNFPANLTSYIDPPYDIDNGNWQTGENGTDPIPLNWKTSGMSNMHYDGTLEYNAKNLYGFSMAEQTYNTMEAVVPGRPFILSRSTFPGAGAYTAHWTGDNAATWDDLRWSIVTMITSGLAGIPNVGADICGFAGNATEQLCNRWISAGAFYPFARNHHMDASVESQGGIPGIPSPNFEHELYRWASVADAGRTVLNKRYELLSYMYSAFADAHLYGCPVARPLWFDDPTDKIALGVNHQFLVGDGVLVSPVVWENATSVGAYVPKGVWYDLWNTSKVVDTTAGAANITINVAMDGKTPLHVRGGTILPLQKSANLTEKVRTSPLNLLVALPKAATAAAPAPAAAAGRKLLQTPAAAAGADMGSHTCGRPATCGVATANSATACGQIFFDKDGKTRFNTAKDVMDHLASLSARVNYAGGSSNGSVWINFGSGKFFGAGGAAGSCPDTQDFPTVDSITVLGLAQQRAPTRVTVSGRPSNAKATFDPASKTLTISGLNLALKCPNNVEITWS